MVTGIPHHSQANKPRVTSIDLLRKCLIRTHPRSRGSSKAGVGLGWGVNIDSALLRVAAQ